MKWPTWHLKAEINVFGCSMHADLSYVIMSPYNMEGFMLLNYSSCKCFILMRVIVSRRSHFRCVCGPWQVWGLGFDLDLCMLCWDERMFSCLHGFSFFLHLHFWHWADAVIQSELKFMAVYITEQLRVKGLAQAPRGGSLVDLGSLVQHLNH